MISHIFLGFIAVWYVWVGGLAVLYQILQLIFDVRVFPVEGAIKEGNNLAHTGLKLLEIALGYGLGYLVRFYV